MTITVRRSGSNVTAPVKVRRGTSWVTPSGVFVRRSGSWVRADAPPPLSGSLTWGGQNPVKVSGASGQANPYTDAGVFYPNVWSLVINGGTPPYTATYVTPIQSAAGKIFAVSSSDGIHTTTGFNGFALNEQEYASFDVNVVDSVGATLTISYAGALYVKRTS